MAGRTLLVVNDEAGSYDEAFRKVCEQVAPEATLGAVDDIAHEPWDTVVACGGDGTIRATVNRMVATGCQASLGIVPLGTANIVSHVFGLPQESEEALRVAMGGQERSVDVGLCHGEAFLLGCGLGLAERFVTAAGYEEKQRLGPLAYVRRLLAESHAPEVVFCVESDRGEQRLTGAGLIVANVAQLGPGLKPFGDGEAEPDDGHLNLILIRRLSVWSMVRIGAKGLFGRAGDDQAIELFPAGKCRISSEPKVPIQIDGDAVEQTAPFAFDVLPARLRVRVP